jgi:hypothetical protein
MVWYAQLSLSNLRKFNYIDILSLQLLIVVRSRNYITVKPQLKFFFTCNSIWKLFHLKGREQLG